MLQIISPPTFFSLASLSVKIPKEVDIIATPKPFWTLGRVSNLE